MPSNIPTDIFVSIRSEEQLLFQDQARSVSSENEKGKFDILPRHANFISLIKNFVTVIKKDGTKQDFKIDIGLMRVADDKVNVYLGVGNRSAKNTPGVK